MPGFTLSGERNHLILALELYTCTVAGSCTLHLPIFFWVGFRWDGLQGPEMGGMDPTCRQKNCEGWLVGVWDGDRWDPSHPFQVHNGHPTEIPLKRILGGVL